MCYNLNTMTTFNPELLGSDPINIKWSIVRGDTARIRIDFLNSDEVTPFDISSWDIIATAYDAKNDTAYELEVTSGNGYVNIVAPADITAEWGSGYKSVINELSLDVQTSFGDIVWTPIIGSIIVIADISGGL